MSCVIIYWAWIAGPAPTPVHKPMVALGSVPCKTRTDGCQVCSDRKLSDFWSCATLLNYYTLATDQNVPKLLYTVCKVFEKCCWARLSGCIFYTADLCCFPLWANIKQCKHCSLVWPLAHSTSRLILKIYLHCLQTRPWRCVVCVTCADRTKNFESGAPSTAANSLLSAGPVRSYILPKLPKSQHCCVISV